MGDRGGVHGTVGAFGLALAVTGCAQGSNVPQPFASSLASAGNETGDPPSDDDDSAADSGTTLAGDGTADSSADATTEGLQPCGGMTCDANASCQGDVCECEPGFVGDGEQCDDEDGCAAAPCFAGVPCTDEPAPGIGFTCGDCPPGLEGDGVACSEADGCANEPCFVGVPCTDVPAPGDGFTCGDCPAGFEGNGVACSDINGCADNPCYPGVACGDIPAPDVGFVCGPCPAGLFGDGITCLSAEPFEIGDLTSSSTSSSYFRGNGYVANSDGNLAEFEVYLGLSAGCNVDFYVFESATEGGALTQLWRNTVAAPSGTGYVGSGPSNIPVTSGTYYLLGVGWNCSATYFWSNSGTWAGFDTGVGLFANNRWDNAYPGPSDLYAPPNVGTIGTTYPQLVQWAGG